MKKRLTRSMYDAKLLGVCSGLGHYFNVDPTVIRIIWVIAFFALGFGLLAYLVCGLIMPKEY